MRGRTNVLAMLTTAIVVASLFLAPSIVRVPVAHAVGQPILQVAGSTATRSYGSNITDTSLVVGQLFTMTVNVTNAGFLRAFDVTVSYSISNLAKPVISPEGFPNPPVPPSLSGGIFDPSSGSLPNGCSVAVAKREVLDTPFSTIRVAAYLVGSCGQGLDGNGKLFSINFKVIGIGSTSMDVKQASIPGKRDQLVIGPPPGFAPVPNLEVRDGYFLNKAGSQPVASFNYTPSAPMVGDLVTFNASQSFDPAHNSGASKGITRYLWTWGDLSPSNIGSGMTSQHTFITSSTSAGSGFFEVRLIVNDTDGILSRQNAVVFVNPGVSDDIAVEMSLDKGKVNAGDPIKLTVTVHNLGSGNETAKLSVKYDYPSAAVTTELANNAMVELPLISRNRVLNYTIQTTNFPARTYTITARVTNTNATAIDPPQNNEVTQTFTVASINTGQSLSILQLAGISAVALVAVGGLVFFVRRRRSRAESASEQLA